MKVNQINSSHSRSSTTAMRDGEGISGSSADIPILSTDIHPSTNFPRKRWISPPSSPLPTIENCDHDQISRDEMNILSFLFLHLHHKDRQTWVLRPWSTLHEGKSENLMSSWEASFSTSTELSFPDYRLILETWEGKKYGVTSVPWEGHAWARSFNPERSL